MADFKADPNWKPSNLGVDLTVVERLATVATTPKQPCGTRQFMIVPEGYVTKEIPALHELPVPDHIRQNITLVELDSFTGYVKQFKTATTRIFGTTDALGAKFLAILDYHESGKEAKPGRTTHRATYAPRFSDEFHAWHANAGKALSQETFLEHIRRWGYLVTSHTDADLIELISSLEFSTQGQFASKIERTRGGRQLTWNEVVEGSGQVQGKTVTVPDVIELKMPVFLGGKEYEFKADLLYRVSSGRLTIGWELQRVQKLIFEAVNDLVTDIETETELDVFIGEVAS